MPDHVTSRMATLIVLLLAGCTTPGGQIPEVTEAPADTDEETDYTIVLGDISDDPGEVIEGAQPLADYMAARLGDYGITEGRVEVAASADAMIQMLESGEVDLYFDSVYPATLISDASGAQPILRRWRRGVGEYHTIIFTTTASGINETRDLVGDMIALDNPFSTSGFVLPAVYLLEDNLTLQGKQSYDDPVAEDEVGFVFSYDDENTLQWVLSGLVEAGATDNVSFERFSQETRDQLVILAETESVPRQVVLARPGMDEDLLQAVTDILKTVHEDEEGQAALEAFDTTVQFDALPGGIAVTQNRMREMSQLVETIPLP